jgi:DnaJ-class molecular chaperone
MGETQNKNHIIPDIPALESVCQRCGGSGGHANDYSPCGWDDCPLCDGAGSVPTDDGRKILELIERNFRQMFERMDGDDD